eukprot:TRINITY_DN6127_c0_g1_i5.p1 TRINITY_DN6127_c0_g1~~TRINITY_DN6127_c0_g1_i5.p1  ORF type:complete len:311 (+),score=93.99 TRINITY_DN6127_c0_g1_i5:73-933(+)
MIADEIPQSECTTFNMIFNQLGDKGTSIITSAIKNHKHITSLLLSNNEIGDIGAKHIAELIEFNTVLTKINLGGNDIGDEGTVAIADALKVNKTLKWLDMENNRIGNGGAIAIGEALEINQTLEVLGLRGIECGDEGGLAIVQGLRRNQRLEVLWLDRIVFEDEEDEDWDEGKGLELGEEVLCQLEELWVRKLEKVKQEWSQERHGKYPLRFQDAVKEVLLMWNHDQYEEGECEGIRWNELPLEVVMNVIKWLGLYERVLDVWKRDRMNREWKNERNVKHSSGRKR